MKQRFVKELVDGHCECAQCGKRIEGKQNYDTKYEEFVCDDCKDNAK